MVQKRSFESLEIPEWLTEKLKNYNIQVPTDVQEEAIPFILQGKDLIGQSPTGTGKTLSYLLPLLTKINPDEKGIKVIILAPTRELAVQIAKLSNELTNDFGILTVPILGGVNLQRQIENLKKKPQLIVGTPGRVRELIQLRKINAQTVKSIVVDEADKMWQSGFFEEVQSIIKSTLRDRQVILVSATMTPNMVAASLKMLNQPEMVNLSRENKVAPTIKHIYFLSQEKDKAERLKKLMSNYKPQKALVFINSNKGVMPFVNRFRELGFSAEGLNSDLNSLERKAVLEKFRSGKAKMLVTTDLFARGMDVNNIDIVFNFDIPIDAEYYIHRVGRTGRAGKAGLAINFVTPEQKFIMNKYEKQLDISIEEWALSGDDKVFQLREKYKK